MGKLVKKFRESLGKMTLDQEYIRFDQEPISTCYDNAEPDEGVCGDCWHSGINNKICMGFFYMELLIFFFLVAVMAMYHTYRKRANVEMNSRAYYAVFIFITFWLFSRIVYFTDAF